jgi:hypothetical protein
MGSNVNTTPTSVDGSDVGPTISPFQILAFDHKHDASTYISYSMSLSFELQLKIPPPSTPTGLLMFLSDSTL